MGQAATRPTPLFERCFGWLEPHSTAMMEFKAI
jgi:hypothetical protein